MKKVLVAGAIVLALVAGALYWAYSSLDLIVKVALEYYGPDVLGTSVKVDAVHLSTQTGQGAIRGLEIGSPSGFSSPRTARFAEVRLAVDPATLTQPVVVVRDISVIGATIVYERGKGTNLDAIRENIEAYAARSGAKEPASAGSSTRRKFIVDHVSIRGTTVTMTTPGLKGQGIGFDIPDFELNDLGRRKNGLRASELAGIVAFAFASRIAQKIFTNIDLLRHGGIEGAIDTLKGLVK